MAQSFKAQTSPYAAKPSSVSNPVPNAQATEDFFADLPDSPPPASVPAQKPNMLERVGDQIQGGMDQAAQGEVPDFFAELDQPLEDVSVEQIPPEQYDPKAELDSFTDRLKLSFGTTDAQKRDFLRQKFGEANVKKVKDGFIFRPDAKAKWRKVDSDTFSILNDVFADNARTIYEAIIEGGIRGVGAATGALAGAQSGALAGAGLGTAVAPGPGTALGGAGGFITGGGAGALGGFLASGPLATAGAFREGEAMSQRLGIPEDPSRDITGETITAGAIGAVFPLVGGIMAKRKAQSEAAKRLTKDATYTPEAVKREVEAAKRAVQELQEAGIYKEGEFIFTPNQLRPDLPEAKVAAREISSSPEWRKFMADQGDTIQRGYDAIVNRVANLSGSKLGLGKKFSSRIDELEEAEGTLIGKFRQGAELQSKGTPQKVDRFRQSVSDSLKSFGFEAKAPVRDPLTGAVSSVSIKAPTVEQIIEQTGLSRGEATYLQAKLSRLGKLALSDAQGVPLKEIDAEYKALTKDINKFMKSPEKAQLAMELISIKNALRDDWVDAIGKNQPEGAKAAYQSSLERFSEIKDSLKALNSVIKQENVSKEALARQIFSKGRTGLDRIQATRALIQKDDPDLWKDIVGEYFSSTMRAAQDGTGKVNWLKLSKDIEGLGPEALDEMFAGTGLKPKDMQNFLNMAKRVESTKFEALPVAGKMNLLKSGIRVMFSFFGKADAVEQAISSLGKDKAVAKFLNEGGLEELLKELEPKKAGRIRQFVGGAVERVLDKPAVFPARQVARTRIRQGGQDITRLLQGTEIPVEAEAQVPLRPEEP